MRLKNIKVLNILRVKTPEELKCISDYAGVDVVEVVKTVADISFFGKLSSGYQYVHMDFLFNPTELRLCLVHAVLDSRRTLYSKQMEELIVKPNPKLISKVEDAYAKYMNENYVDEELETVRKVYASRIYK